jgi:hypothetical protein
MCIFKRTLCSKPRELEAADLESGIRWLNFLLNQSSPNLLRHLGGFLRRGRRHGSAIRVGAFAEN